MIIVKAPMRISFVGGGSDLPAYYSQSPGRVISSTIDKYVYTVINPAPLLRGISVRYSITEIVKDVKKIKNIRAREALQLFNINDKLEIGIFSHLPVGTGLGGSSSYTVGLIKALSIYLGKTPDRKAIADTACNLEINLAKEPIGKQDQYASAFGGFNVFQFNKDESVDIEPLFLDYKTRIDLNDHCLLFFTGITRQASAVLKEQNKNFNKKMNGVKAMANLVYPFRDCLLKGDYEKLGGLLHKNWLIKKKLASKISNAVIDKIYNSAINSGAWGGKILGAGAGGCILFIVPLDKKNDIRKILLDLSKKLKLDEFKEIPFNFIQSGVEMVTNDQPNR